MATSALLSTTGTGFNYYTTDVSGADEMFNTGFSFGNISQSFTVTFTLTSIPYARYTLVVYALNFNAGDT